MTVLGIVPARGGSKGIPHKNIRLIQGRPLLAYTADAVRASLRLTRTIVSTDDESIARVAADVGLDVPFLRPSPLAADDTPMLPVLRHAVAEMAERGCLADVVVLLQPTSPLRTAAHIDAAVDMLDATGADTVVSVVEVPHQFNPASVMRLDGQRLVPFVEGELVLRRQDKPRAFARNGPAVLAVRAAVLARGVLYGDDVRPLVMGPEESVDLDTAFDLALLEFLLARQR